MTTPRKPPTKPHHSHYHRSPDPIVTHPVDTPGLQIHRLPRFDPSVLDETLAVLSTEGECFSYIDDAAKLILEDSVGGRITVESMLESLKREGQGDWPTVLAHGLGVLFCAGAACALKAVYEGYIPIDEDGASDDNGGDLLP